MASNDDSTNSFAGFDKATLFRFHAVSEEDIKHAIKFGRIAGGVYSFLALVIIVIYGSLLPEDEPLTGRWYFWGILLVFFVLSIYFGGIVRRKKFETASQKGFLRIDLNHIEYWTSGGIKTIDMGLLFGARSEKVYQDTGLRLCYLDYNERGFNTLVHDFAKYEIVEGPIIEGMSRNPDGNEAAAEVIRHYIGQRRASGQQVAEFPAFRFDSKAMHRKQVVFGEKVVDASFECDGKNVTIVTKGEIHEFPVTAVEDIDINKITNRGVSSVFDVTVILDQSHEGREIFLDLVNMSQNDEVEYYAVCLPAMIQTDTP